MKSPRPNSIVHFSTFPDFKAIFILGMPSQKRLSGVLYRYVMTSGNYICENLYFVETISKVIVKKWPCQNQRVCDQRLFVISV